MIDDAKIRTALLALFPDLIPHNLEIEEFEYGDVLGVAYFHDGTRERCQTKARDRSEADITADLARGVAAWLVPEIAAPVRRGPGRPRKAA